MANDRIRTNVPGFDRHVEGGFVGNSINLISGGPGTGKTIFCLQFMYEGIMKENEKGFWEKNSDLKY